MTPPLIMRLLNASSLLRQIPARLIGLGIRPEHIAPELREAFVEQPQT